MSIQSLSYNLLLNRALVDPATGIPAMDGRDLILALFNRTGGRSGIVPNVSPLLTATGLTISDALQLAADWNMLGAVPAGSGVQILTLKPGNDIAVLNLDPAQAVNVYPPTTAAQIDALGAGTPFSLAAGKLRRFECWTQIQFASWGN